MAWRRPFVEQSPVEPFDLAVGLRFVGLGEGVLDGVIEQLGGEVF
jgi:hypothetical protein